jgi:hypothetical protein
MSNIVNFDRGYATCSRTSANWSVVMPSHAAFGKRGMAVQTDLAVEAAAKPATGTGPRTWSPPI